LKREGAGDAPDQEGKQPMPLISGRIRKQENPVLAPQQLDPYLPKSDPLRPSWLWRIVTRIVVVLTLLVAGVVVADRLHLLPSPLPFLNPHIREPDKKL